MRIESAAPAAVIPGEVRPEELTELVERLHRRQEHLSVGDVAETLGVTTEAVETTLRAMRSERVPPVTTKKTVVPGRPVRLRRGVALALAGLTLWGLGFAIGRDTAPRPFRYPQSLVAASGGAYTRPDLLDKLRKALPAGTELRVGNLSYVGAKNQVGGAEEELARLVAGLVAREAPDLTTGERDMSDQARASVRDKIKDGASGTLPVSASIEWTKIEVRSPGFIENRVMYVPSLKGTYDGGEGLLEELRLARTSAARSAANALTEWGKARR